MVDVKDAGEMFTGFLPRLAIKSIVNIVAWAVIAAVILIVVGLATYFFMRNMKYNKKIVIWEKIGNQFQPTRKDRAMEVKLSTAGDTVIFLRRHKKYLPNPKFQTGTRVYYYFIREDDEWINFRPDDLDEVSKKMGAVFLDKEMRFARTQIQKGLKERYDKPGFWKQYGLLVFSITFIVIIGIFTWLLFDKWLDLAGATVNAVNVGKEVLVETRNVLAALDNVCSGGSGMRPAG
jgi:hypothetical protein